LSKRGQLLTWPPTAGFSGWLFAWVVIIIFPLNCYRLVFVFFFGGRGNLIKSFGRQGKVNLPYKLRVYSLTVYHSLARRKLDP